mmetsp:Transcript_42437/g.43205  ORF Transcript_42437/g.43205 Transcript_42437/m.43205 type:complete len:80 (+) Transcript_42437:108-347(+)
MAAATATIPITSLSEIFDSEVTFSTLKKVHTPFLLDIQKLFHGSKHQKTTTTPVHWHYHRTIESHTHQEIEKRTTSRKG